MLAMSIPQKLREQTSVCHSAIEANPLLKRLTQNLSLMEYINILIKFYSFYLRLEKSLDWTKIATLTEMKFTADKQKFPILEKDLSYFGVSLEEIPLSPYYPRLQTLPAILGCFYVLEGSCHGRKMMWPRLSAKLSIKENEGGAFFCDSVNQPQENWKCFCELLTSKVKTEADETECILTAVQTFKDLDQWFKT